MQNNNDIHHIIRTSMMVTVDDINHLNVIPEIFSRNKTK